MTDDVFSLFFRGVEHIIVKRELCERLQKKERLRVYYGVDPTGSQIHLGHYVILRKLAKLQEMGHEIIFLIGDFTARIGDPTDRGAMRVPLTHKQVLENAKTYQKQVSNFIDFDGKNQASLVFNGKWLDSMTFKDVIDIASKFTVQQLLERDMFQKRIEDEKPIGLHEFLYPLMQGYDSVQLDVDLEIGGSDQLFNMLAGRTLLKKIKNKEKYVMAVQLLEGTDGRKMSKSYGNIISIVDEPADMYGKLMSIKDELIIRYFQLCTDVSDEEIKKMEMDMKNNSNPRDFKMQLAFQIVSDIYSEEKAKEAEENFKNIFQKNKVPTNMPEKEMKKGNYSIMDLLLSLGLVSSKGEARRVIEQGGVRVNSKVISDISYVVSLVDESIILQKGKLHYMKIKVS